MLKEEMIIGAGYSFVCSNKTTCSKTVEHPDGIRYMTDAAFEAHKAEQEINACLQRGQEGLGEAEQVLQRRATLLTAEKAVALQAHIDERRSTLLKVQRRQEAITKLEALGLTREQIAALVG